MPNSKKRKSNKTYRPTDEPFKIKITYLFGIQNETVGFPTRQARDVAFNTLVRDQKKENIEKLKKIDP